MRFFGKFVTRRIDRGSFTKELHRRGDIILREGAREWVRAVFIRIPVWTGMARGSIKYAKGRSGESAGQFLATYLRVAIPIGPQRTWDDGPIILRPDKTPEIGGHQSRYTFSSKNGKFHFTFQTNVVHLINNDLYFGSASSGFTPWQAFSAGKEAFETHLRKTLKTVIPKLKDHIEKSVITIG